jgi:hypothetical protein
VIISRGVPGHYWVQVGVSFSREFEPGHSWLYSGLVRRDAWRLGRVGIYLMRMPNDDHLRPQPTDGRSPVSDQDLLAQIKARRAAAADLPWRVVDDPGEEYFGDWHRIETAVEGGFGALVALVSSSRTRQLAHFLERAPADIDWLLDEIKQLARERDLAVAHDRQPYPTAEAYERVCAALERQRGEVDRLRDLLGRLEWAGCHREEPACPVCQVYGTGDPQQREGHLPDCWLADELGKRRHPTPKAGLGHQREPRQEET